MGPGEPVVTEGQQDQGGWCGAGKERIKESPRAEGRVLGRLAGRCKALGCYQSLGATDSFE